MKYLEQRETRAHGTFDFPFALYDITYSHPRYYMVDHWHPEYEIIYIQDGEFSASVNGHKYVGKVGDLIVVPDGALHGGIPHNCRYSCLVINLHTVIDMSPICKQLAQPVLFGGSQFIQHIKGGNPELQTVVDRLFHSMGSRESYAPFHVIGAVYDLIGLLLEQYTEIRIVKTQEAEMRRLSRIKDVLRLIRNHYSEVITLEELAACAHMNKRYFCRYFREVMGKTPMRYLNYYRIECACELLATTDKSISETALICGFNNISYFNRAFRTLKGITPSEYEKVHC
jgi:AraC-like DNA-binding protein